MGAAIIATVAKKHFTNTKHSKLFPLLSERLPELVPNPQGRKGEEETTKVLSGKSEQKYLC